MCILNPRGKQHIGLNEEIKWNYWDVRPTEGGGEEGSICQVLHCLVIAVLFWDGMINRASHLCRISWLALKGWSFFIAQLCLQIFKRQLAVAGCAVTCVGERLVECQEVVIVAYSPGVGGGGEHPLTYIHTLTSINSVEHPLSFDSGH